MQRGKNLRHSRLTSGGLISALNLGKLGVPEMSGIFFSNRVFNRWNLLDKRTVDALNLMHSRTDY